MEHIAAILLLVGCSGDLKQCDELPAPTAIYETEQDCGAELGRSMAGIIGQRPRVFGTCVYVDPAMEESDAELVWDIKDGALHATIETPATEVASNASGHETQRQQ